ncbi:MAG: ribonuclease Z [Elusimicrobia bacterium]|nr:ribonuclease Z [Elusimicrobiota bacterium]
MKARWTFLVLGSGAFAPGPGERGARVRNPAGYALDTGDGLLLFDFGFGNLRQLYRAGRRSREVRHAFFSHRHPDHVGDLAALLFQLRCDVKPEGGRLSLYGPRGFTAFVERLRGAYGPWLEPKGYALEVRELESGEKVARDGWTVSCRSVPHPAESLAYRLDSSGGSLCYSGDTGYDPGLAEFARGVDLSVLECTLPDSARYRWHLRVREALSLARESGARRSLLTHLSEGSGRQAARRLPRNVSLARDLQKLRL